MQVVLPLLRVLPPPPLLLALVLELWNAPLPQPALLLHLLLWLLLQPLLHLLLLPLLVLLLLKQHRLPVRVGSQVQLLE